MQVISLNKTDKIPVVKMEKKLMKKICTIKYVNIDDIANQPLPLYT